MTDRDHDGTDDEQERRNRQLDQLLQETRVVMPGGHIIKVANRFVIAGVAFLAAAMTLALILVCDYVFDGKTATVVAVVAGAAFAWFWFIAPLLRRNREQFGS